MKQLEEETSILHAGLTMLDSARDWYKRQLAAVADKQAMLGKVSYNVSRSGICITTFLTFAVRFELTGI